ncbi:MAG: phosphoribosylformylglycinamidine cyclo-ligase, partial [Clostridium perfringens]|nr:phosphoribosylformylglycinamidine cyclo-ligase [Clostridium perfringens]
IKSQCSLIGGETAEMPGMYKEGDYDIAGFAVGIVDKDKIINGKDIKSGDKLIGIASSGVHSNGYSLIRKVFKNLDEDFNGKAIWEELLTPTKIYVKPVLSLLEKFNIKGMAHVTGGGFYENLPRMLSEEGLSIVINKNSYEIPEIFKKLMELGVQEEEMYNTFNMGIGFVLCVEEDEVEEVLKELSKQGEKAFEIGYINAGGEGVCIK